MRTFRTTWLLAGLAASAGAQTTFTATYTNAFGDGIWRRDQHIAVIGNPNDFSTPGNWSTGAYPNNGHTISDPNNGQVIPGANPLYDVVLGSGASCTLDGSVTIQSVSLASGATLSILPSGFLRFSTTQGLVNNATIVVNPAADPNNDAGIAFNGSASFPSSQITGSGSIQLNGINLNDALLLNNNGSGGSLTHAANHLIHGRGDIETDDLGAMWINNGPIEADVNGSALRMYWSGEAGNQNNALMRAINGGILYFHGGRFTQGAAGKIRAENGSVVVLGEINSANNHLFINGGMFETTGTGVLDVGTLDADGVTNTGTMQVQPGRFMTINSNGFVNNGTILLNTTAGSNDSAFHIVGNTQLTGSGSLQLNGAALNDAKIFNGGFTFTHGAAHRIHGRGDMDIDDGASVFINNGLVEADMNGGQLRIFINGQANTNNNLMRALNGGNLYFHGGILNQVPAAKIRAENASSVTLGEINSPNNHFALNGGILETTGTGLLDVGTLDVNGVTNTGRMELKPGCLMRLNANGLVNNGSILLNSTAGTSDSRLEILANTQLTGTGRLQLNGVDQNDANIYNGGFTFTQGANHLIHGRGDLDIDDGVSVFINNGILDADENGGELRLFINGQAGNANNNIFRATNGGTLFWEVGRLDQSSGGTISAAAGSTVVLGNIGFANNTITLFGGNMTTTGNGVIKGGTVDLAGTITNQGNFQITRTLVSATRLINNGTITNVAVNPELRFTNNSTIIDGTGAIILSNGLNVSINGGQDVVNGNGHRIKGEGSFSIAGLASLTNNGTFAPGNSAGRITINGKFSQGNTGILEIELGGTTPTTDFDQLIVNGPFTLGGQLNLSLINGFLPSPADTFKIVQSNQPLLGSFLNVGNGERVNTIGGTGSFIVTSTGNEMILSSFGPPVAGGGFNMRLTNPKFGGDHGGVTMTLVGTGAQQGATVRLRRAGHPDLIAASVAVSADGTTITARFFLNGQALGAWDIVVTNPDNTSFVLAGGFTIEASRQAKVWADLLHRPTIRFNSFSRFTIVVGNNGNNDAFAVPVFVSGIPSDAQVVLESDLLPIPNIPGLPAGANPNAVSPVVDTPSGKVLGIFVPVIPAGGTFSFQFTVNVPTGRTFQVNTTALPPLLEAVDLQATGRGSGPIYHLAVGNSTFGVRVSDAVLTCLNSIFANAGSCISSFIPGADCANALFDTANLINTMVDMINGNSSNNLGSGAVSVSQLFFGTITTALSAAGCLGDFTPAGIVFNIIGCGFGALSILIDCADAFSSHPVTAVGAIDPNDKVGAFGFGTEHYLTGNEPFRYAIFFENVANASAPAQYVTITDQLDVSKYDLDTFQLGAISFGADTLLTPPSGLTEWVVDQDLRPARQLIARVTAKLNKTSGLITWRFFSLDPATMTPTTDPLAGFLPPNQNSPEGDGLVTFTIKVKPGLATGTQVLNKASIVFDSNPPIDTPQWLNTIDNSPPTSQVTALSGTSNSSAINLSWSGSDNGAGIRYYAIYVSENGGAFTLWKNTTATSGVFQGRPNTSYSFYSVAVDGANNFEAIPGVGDTSTTTLSGQLLNIATRLQVRTGENVLIGGMIITGTEPKKVILRAIGPSLANFLQGALADPVLDLYQNSTLLATNDNWKDSQQTDIEATGLQPADDSESAIVRTLAPGAYTAVLSGKNGTTGIAVVEAYDLDQAANSKLGNISSRGLVSVGNDVMIGGVIVGGTNNADVRVLIRGIGPSLGTFGIQGALQDPTLELANSNGTIIRSNDNWQDSQRTEIQETAIPPSNAAESAIVATLTPGNYTAILRGKNNSSGVGLVEVYNVP